MTENVKKISLQTYEIYFKELISINTPSNIGLENVEKTAIFYDLNTELDTITISFAFDPFIIVVPISLNKLQEKYNERYELDEDRPDFIVWINTNYMDARGILEL